MSSGMVIGGSRDREALATGEPRLEGPAPGKQSRADPFSLREQGAPSAAPGPRADGALADARAEDWAMSPELASAFGIDGLEDHAAQGNAPVQRRPSPMPGWAQPQPRTQQSVAAAPAQPAASATLAFVREEGLNLRAGPGQQAAALTHMKFGQRVQVLDNSGQGDWLKIAVLGQTGYAYKPRIHFPPKDLVAKDPGLSLIKVKPGQTFWGLVKDSYGPGGSNPELGESAR
jgi:Bacterial SH3 domain